MNVALHMMKTTWRIFRYIVFNNNILEGKLYSFYDFVYKLFCDFKDMRVWKFWNVVETSKMLFLEIINLNYYFVYLYEISKYVDLK